MIVFGISDKGGTGRSVTTCNLAYRQALAGANVCYLDFDFGSPTAGAIFMIDPLSRGTRSRQGMHEYLAGRVASPEQVDVWAATDRLEMRNQPIGVGRLALLPGDEGGGEFRDTREHTRRCAELFVRLDEEFDLILVDLSAGRSFAAQMVLSATATAQTRSIVSRWLVFHRWTRQHIIAAAGLAFRPNGIMDAGEKRGHDPEELRDAIRFVRTAVVEADSALGVLRPTQAAWLQHCNQDLQELSSKAGLGRSVTIGSIPLDPVLQWREQIITDGDVLDAQIANTETAEAFENLAKRLTDVTAWEGI